MGEFLMPSLGADMEAGTLIEWEKKPGDAVTRGDVIAVVETQKGAIEIEVFEDGILDSYLVEIGKPVPVGTPLALISGASGSKPKPVPTQDEPTIPEQAPIPKAATAPHSKLASVDVRPEPDAIPENTGERPRITPAARKQAAQSGIELSSLTGTGPNGEIVLADVQQTAATSTESPEKKPSTDMSGMRSAIAAAMSRSKREIPHYYLSQTVDLSNAEKMVTSTNADREPAERLLLGALYVKAVAMAAVKYPEFNGHYTDGTFHSNESVHAGMAINLRGGGLVAPAIHNAHELNLDDLMKQMRDLVSRVRAGRFRAAELSDSTITVSSLGERGVESLYGVIYPPQVAIVGVGSPKMRPMIDNDNVHARLGSVLTLAGDHRVSDGHRGALFLTRIQKLLEEPELLTCPAK